MNYFWAFGLMFGLVAIYFLTLGLRGLLANKPFVLPARQMLIVLFLCFLPSFFFSGRALINLELRTFDFFTVFPVLMNAFLVIVLWKQFSGYMVVGVTDESFRAALHSALHKLDLPFQETVSQIQLTSLDTQLQASVQGWTGVAQFRLKHQRYAKVLRSIADAMNEYYSSTPTKMNRMALVVYIILGACMLVFALNSLLNSPRSF